jgi:toxin ParE1/3/4
MEEEINRQMTMLAEFPTLGREGRVPGTRELVINRSPFVLVFRMRNQQIEIIRLLHGAQMWPRS